MQNTQTAPLAHRVPEACARLGIGKSLFYDLVAAGEIKTFRVGSRVLVAESELREFIAKRMQEAA